MLQKLAVLNRHFSRRAGGAEGYSVALAEGLAQCLAADGSAAFEVHVFAQVLPQECERRHPLMAYHKVPGPIRHPRWLNQAWFSLYTWWKTRTGFVVISHENTWHGQVQVVHVRPIRYNLFFSQQQRRTGWQKVLRWLQVITSLRLSFYVWLEAARMRAAYEHGTIVAVSQAIEQQTRLAYPWLTAQDIQVVLPGVGEPNHSRTRLQARQGLGIPQHCTALLLFVGNDYARKGLETLLLALQGLAEGVHLAVAGGPQAKQKRQFQAQALALGLGERVHFVGSLSDMSQAYQAADILVHPTREDSFAMVVLEAMSYGLPVLVSSARYCGITSFLKDAETALVLQDPTDAMVLRGEIARLLADTDLQMALRQGGHAFAAKHAWHGVVQRYCEILSRQDR